MYSILNEIINDIMTNGKLTINNMLNLLVVKNEDGDVVVTYKNPANNKDIKEAKAYIDSLDDDIFVAASKALKNDNLDAYNTINAQINNPSNLESFNKAFAEFKVAVTTVVNNKINELEEQIDYLYNKYLDEED